MRNPYLGMALMITWHWAGYWPHVTNDRHWGPAEECNEPECSGHIIRGEE